MQQQQVFPSISHGILVGRLNTLSSLNKSLDTDFQNQLRASGGLYQFLFLPECSILTRVIEKLLKYFDQNSNTFLINGQRLGITLQDILFICHLPISGKPVLVERCPNDEAFKRVYGQDPPEKKMIVKFYTNIACDSSRSLEQRKIAVLMIIIRSFIMPSQASNQLPTSFVALLENVDSVSTYAWGAAVLSFLLTGIGNFISLKKKRLDGNFWVFLAFFFYRIPKLWNAIGVEPQPQEDSSCPIEEFIKNLSKISYNHRKTYEMVDDVLANLIEGDITLLPYDVHKLPVQLQPEAYLASRVSPIFCNNHVVHHKPHLVAKQFGLNNFAFENSFEFMEYTIKTKTNVGPFAHNYHKDFKNELKYWNDCVCLFDFHRPEPNLQSQLIANGSPKIQDASNNSQNDDNARTSSELYEAGSSKRRTPPRTSSELKEEGPSSVLI